MIDQKDLIRVLDGIRGDAVVITSMRIAIRWPETTGNDNRVIPLDSAFIPSAMGKVSSFGLGLALAQPDTKVILLDGDGGLLMNLGTLVTVANKAPENLYHFVVDNGVYATTGGQSTPGAGTSSFTEMADGAGYANTYDFTDLEEFTNRAEEVLNTPGPSLIRIDTVPDIRAPGERATGRQRPAASRPRAFNVIRDKMKELGTA